MQIAMATWMRIEPIETVIRRMARLGYDSIEISGEPELVDAKEVSKLLKENDLECWGGVSIMVEGRDLIHPEESVRASTIRYLKDCVTMLKELDSSIFTIVPAQVGKTKPTSTAEQEWAWAIEGLREVYVHSEREGIALALEPINRFETYFLNRHDQALLLAEAVGPNCGVCLDCFHLNIELRLVLGRDEFLADERRDHKAAGKNRHSRKQHQKPVVQRKTQRSTVSRFDGPEHAFQRLVDAVLVIGKLQHARAQHGRQRHGDKR